MLEGQDHGQQVGVAGPLADAVDAGVDPRVLAGVQIAERPGHRVGHGQAEVVAAVRLDRRAQDRGQLGEAVAAALWPKLSATPPTPVQADPYAVVMSGLGVLTGPKHGGAALAAERMLAATADAARVIAERLRSGEGIPGLGHMVYKTGDARGITLMNLVRTAWPDNERLAVAEALVAERSARRLPALNIDFALAAFGATAGLVPGAGQAVFAIARTAGWLAHALEEYQRQSPLRPRAVYVGPDSS
nr:citrate/2-methylcitrate synthase [Catenulispora pinistramenti]